MEFAILVLVFLFVSFVLPLINTKAIRRLENEIEALKTRLARHERSAPDSAQAQAPAPVPPPKPAAHPVPAQSAAPLIIDTPWIAPKKQAPAKPAAPVAATGKTTASFTIPSFDRLLARLPVWIGAIALVFACLYFVKYSIEVGLLSPAVRLMIGAATSAVAIAAGYLLIGKKSIANHERIAQALSGAGVAGLYICAYMAAHLYGLIAPQAAILLMVCVTALAVFLSLRMGVAVALLGLLGGFALPLLTQFQHVNTGSLFTYFFVLTMGLVFVAALRGWGWLAALALLAFYGWGFGTLFERAQIEHTATYVGGFSLLTIAGILLIASLLPRLPVRHDNSATIVERAVILSAVLSGIALITAMFRIDMSVTTTGMYALLTVGAAVLAVFRQRLYLHGAFIAMAVFAGLLLVVPTLTLPALLVGLGAFGVLIAIGYGAMQHNRADARDWSFYTVGTVIAGFYVAFLEKSLLPIDIAAYHGWEILAVLIAALSGHTFLRWSKTDDSVTAAIWAACAAFFAAVAPILFFNSPHFTGLALLAQAAALAMIYGRYGHYILARFVPAFFGLAGIFLLGEAVKFATISLREFAKTPLHGLSSHTNIISSMQADLQNGQHLFVTGIATTLLCAAIWYGLHRGFARHPQAAKPSAKPYAVIAGLVAAGSAYTLVQLIAYGYVAVHLPVAMLQAEFIVRTGLTVLLGLLALALLTKHARSETLMTAAVAVLAFAAWRTFYFDLLVYNPAARRGYDIGDMPLFNMLAPLYLVPAVITAVFAWKTPYRDFLRSAGLFASVSAALAFIFVSYSVRQWYHGGNLRHGETSTLELFSYSVAWLLFGLAVVTGGTLTRIRAVRMAGAAMVALVIIKVFLYDAAMLDGLYRVFAFIGLGVSLLLLSWFYGRLERRAQSG